MQFCQMMRVIDLPDGHMLVYGSATLCQKSMVDLVCHVKGIRTLTLTYCDISGDRYAASICHFEKKINAKKTQSNSRKNINSSKYVLQKFNNLNYFFSQKKLLNFIHRLFAKFFPRLSFSNKLSSNYDFFQKLTEFSEKLRDFLKPNN